MALSFPYLIPSNKLALEYPNDILLCICTNPYLTVGVVKYSEVLTT